MLNVCVCVCVCIAGGTEAGSRGHKEPLEATKACTLGGPRSNSYPHHKWQHPCKLEGKFSL